MRWRPLSHPTPSLLGAATWGRGALTSSGERLPGEAQPPGGRLRLREERPEEPWLRLPDELREREAEPPDERWDEELRALDRGGDELRLGARDADERSLDGGGL